MSQPGPSRSLDRIGSLLSRAISIAGLSQEIRAVLLAVETGGRVSELLNTAEPVAFPDDRRHYSESLWPAVGGATRLIQSAENELDRTHDADRVLLDAGAKSVLTVPFRTDSLMGLLLLWSRETGMFGAQGATLLVPMIEFIAVAAERERAWVIEQIRHQRRVRLEAALPKIAESLDVRKVFVELSGLIKEVIPHDVLAFALLLPDRSGVRVQAATERGVLDLPEYRFSNPEEALDANWNFLLAYDLTPVDESSVRARISPLSATEVVEVVTRPGPAWMRFIAQARVRSIMRVPIRSKDRPIGGVAFMSRSPDAYESEDGIVASRIADQLALALAHQKLAEEELRKSRLAALDAMLPQLETVNDIDGIAVAVSRMARGILDHDAVGVLVSHSSGGHIHGVFDGDKRHSLDVSHDFIETQFRHARERGPQLVEIATESEYQSIMRTGMRSELRVPVRQGKEMVGAIVFGSRQPGQFSELDVAIAQRFADRVSLRIAHERIEGARRRESEASARARALEEQVEMLQHELNRFSAHRAIGTSIQWKQALKDATQVAATDTTVLITGESGTGKEVIARFIHRGSKRANGPFAALNCAALPEQLLESELFGHERGAFTGAVDARPGKIEQAKGGVLFLDEVGEMSPAVQAKFLRVLQEREFQRLGGTRTIKADVRIVAATNRNPRAAIASGAFREDLYYRLGVFEIHLPPLRERPEDIPVLAAAFLEEVGQTIGRPAAGFSEDAVEQLLVHTWPGNVRELRNAVERAVILCHGGLVTREHLPITVSRLQAERVAVAAPKAEDFPIEGVALDAVERELLEKAMAKAGNNKSHAARLLSLSRGQLYSLLRKHGLTDARR